MSEVPTSFLGVAILARLFSGQLHLAGPRAM